jgi:hypothetical protein
MDDSRSETRRSPMCTRRLQATIRIPPSYLVHRPRGANIVTPAAGRAFFRNDCIAWSSPSTPEMDFMRHPLLSASASVLTCLATLAACDPSAATESLRDDPSDVVFLAMDAEQNVYPDALFQGRVTLDAQGCLRLATADQHTVIWPHGYTLEADGGELRVKAAGGREVGAVGGSFRFGGGELTSLEHVGHLSATTRAQAEARCPGRYWMAAP